MIAVTSAFMLVIVALAPRVLLGLGDSYDQDSQNWYEISIFIRFDRFCLPLF